MSAPILAEPTELTSDEHPLLLFFDGECAFCNRWVNRVRDADRSHRTRFATKQGETFRRVAQAHPKLAKVDSVVLVRRDVRGREEFLVRSAAARRLIDGLPGFRVFTWVLNLVPLALADLGYRIFAKMRSRLFGKLAQCRVPSESERRLFLD